MKLSNDDYNAMLETNKILRAKRKFRMVYKFKYTKCDGGNYISHEWMFKYRRKFVRVVEVGTDQYVINEHETTYICKDCFNSEESDNYISKNYRKFE